MEALISINYFNEFFFYTISCNNQLLELIENLIDKQLYWSQRLNQEPMLNRPLVEHLFLVAKKKKRDEQKMFALKKKLLLVNLNELV